MAQWIAFDERDVSVLSARTRGEVELGVGDALTVALDGRTESMVLLPDGEGRVTVLRLRTFGVPQAQHPEESVAAGFLGLMDTASGEETPVPQRSWLKRLFRP